MNRRPAALGLALAISGASVAGLAGCTEGPDRMPPPLPVSWRPVTLPGATPTVAELGHCAGRWYAAGAVAAERAPTAAPAPTTPAPPTTPAAWASTDGVAWVPIVLRATTPYGHQGSFLSLACRDGNVVALGSATGGIHGNPRVSSWRSQPDGGWTEVQAPFDLYGGQNAGSVDRVVSGPAGWLIVGHRVSPTTGQRGAAVWFSANGTAFQLVDDDPALRSTTTNYTTASDAAAGPDGWVLVGSAGSAISPDPAAWASADGLHWRRTTVTSSRPGTIARVTPYPRSGLLFAGSDHAWLLAADRQSLDQAGVVCGTEVSALTTAETAAGTTAVAAAGSRLCASRDGATWRDITPPGPLPAGAQLRSSFISDLVATTNGS